MLHQPIGGIHQVNGCFLIVAFKLMLLYFVFETHRMKLFTNIRIKRHTYQKRIPSLLLEDGRQKTEDGRQKTEDGRRKTEDRRQKTEDRRRKTEDRRRKTED